jgi:hypothetical protein
MVLTRSDSIIAEIGDLLPAASRVARQRPWPRRLPTLSDRRASTGPGSLGYLTVRSYRLWHIFASHPDLAIVFKAFGDNVEVPLEVVPLLLPQLFRCKRLDGVV